MFKRIGLCSLILSFTSFDCFAVAPGYYLGLSVGAAQNDGKAVTAIRPIPPGGTTTAVPTKRQFAGRLFTGYKFNPWISWELGGTVFSVINYHAPVSTCGQTKIWLGAIDTVLKPSITVGPVDVYAKGGISVNYLVNSAALNRSGVCTKHKKQWTFGATYGIGASYDLTQSWVADVSWTRINVGQFLGSVNYYAIGIAYHFVDRYCGQFLCDD